MSTIQRPVHLSTSESERTWPSVLSSLLAGQDLVRGDTAWAMDQVMAGEASPVQLAGFLVALRAKGETVDEVQGLVESMLEHAVRIEVPGPCVDVVGTGGDRRNTVNISTMAALVAAGAGARVVKHGNRAASSSAGSADVLEALGVRLDLASDRIAEMACEVGITFCFAQLFHPAMRHAAAARRELGVATAFNFLGPLTNPAQPAASAIGVADLRMAPVVAGVVAARGRSALVFRGDDGLDELTTAGPSTVWWVRAGEVSRHTLDPADLGIPRSSLDELVGGDAAHNAGVARELLAGRPGPVRDAVLLNAAAALVALEEHSAGAAGGAPAQPGADADAQLLAGFGVALDRARAAVDDGRAASVLAAWRSATSR